MIEAARKRLPHVDFEIADIATWNPPDAFDLILANAVLQWLPDHGTLAAGKRADFLVLDGNPLDDIRNTRRIARMFIGGKEIDRAALKAAFQMVSYFESVRQ